MHIQINTRYSRRNDDTIYMCVCVRIGTLSLCYVIKKEKRKKDSSCTMCNLC